MPTSELVTAGKPKVGGSVHRAPLGTTLPTDAASTLDAAFKDMGYVSDDGVTNSTSFDGMKAWGGDQVLNLSNEDNFKMKLIEAKNVEVLKAVFGDDNVSGNLENGITVAKNISGVEEQYSWVIDMILKGNVLKRIVIPRAGITEIGDIVYSDSEAVAYDVTLGAVEDTAGNTHYEYLVQAGGGSI